MDKITQADIVLAQKFWNLFPSKIITVDWYAEQIAAHRLATRTDATPVATDVAALVEAAKASAEGWANAVEFKLLPVQHWQTANDLQRQLRQALVPFTEGQP